jgi:1-acyl-sn-glycerol-3-phosphate acyltransferase
VTARAEVEAKAWHPPFWLYTRGRFLRRLSWPITLLHRHFVPRVYLVGAEGLKQLPRSVVFVATHRSFADVPTLQRAFRESPAHDRWNRFVIAAAGGIVADAGVAGRFVTAAYGLFPLRQYSEREASLQQLAKVIDAGNSLVMFPQGHHTLPADEVALTPLSRFQPGAAFLAMQLGLPVVPVGIAGDELVVPGRVPPGYKGMVVAGIAVKLQRHSVAVAFGPALSPLPGEAAPAFTARIEAAAFLLARRAQALLENKD